MSLEQQLVAHFLKRELIQEEEKEIIEYGLESLKNFVTGAVAVIIVGYLYGYLWECVLIWIFVMPLRKNAGGFHASTKLKCIITSIITLSIILTVYFQLGLPDVMYLALDVVWGGIIYSFSPVENQNKSLDHAEYETYRHRTRMILLIESCLLAAGMVLHMENLVRILSSSLAIVGVAVLAGVVIAKKLSCEKQED